ncbi:hypothetical protein IFO70_12635 [Phormidium tenue FACHB-886]|nr:hypothetical protein [Phormidium tenue FACHB-886]
MKSNANSDAASNSSPNSSAVPGAAVSSVPIPVYRELAAELQATRVMLESIHTKNKQLTQQNQQLRQEIERVVQLGSALRHWVEPTSSAGGTLEHSAPQRADRPAPSPESTAEAAAIAAKLRDSTLISDELFTEEGLPPNRPETKPAKDFSGLWLTLTILFIIVTAFGAGFLVMKPFLSSR